MDKIKIIDIIEKLINQERENSKKYCEVNPNDANRRQMIECYVTGAYIRMLHELTE